MKKILIYVQLSDFQSRSFGVKTTARGRAAERGGSIGTFGISSNVFGAGINYSQNGGWSVNAAGFQYGRGGLSSDPNIGVSYTRTQGKSISPSEGIGVTSLDQSPISTNQELYAYLIENGIDPATYYALSIDIENLFRRNKRH
ncbi:hypothetical protein FACS1894182_15250 [Bacteroidia bacterium]|nr:hypothetical protein FACS1894182_15250 [Bacteroidia bacterium]